MRFLLNWWNLPPCPVYVQSGLPPEIWLGELDGHHQRKLSGTSLRQLALKHRKTCMLSQDVFPFLKAVCEKNFNFALPRTLVSVMATGLLWWDWSKTEGHLQNTFLPHRSAKRWMTSRRNMRLKWKRKRKNWNVLPESSMKKRKLKNWLMNRRKKKKILSRQSWSTCLWVRSQTFPSRSRSSRVRNLRRLEFSYRILFPWSIIFLTKITIRIKRSVLISEKASIIYGEFLRWEYPQIIHFSNVIPRL